MRKFKVQFIKVSKVIGPAAQVLQIAEQNYLCETEKINIAIPEGYALASVTEYLPDVIQKTNGNEKSIYNLKK